MGAKGTIDWAWVLGEKWMVEDGSHYREAKSENGILDGSNGDIIMANCCCGFEVIVVLVAVVDLSWKYYLWLWIWIEGDSGGASKVIMVVIGGVGLRHV